MLESVTIPSRAGYAAGSDALDAFSLTEDATISKSMSLSFFAFVGIDQPSTDFLDRTGHGGQRRMAEVRTEDVVEAGDADRARHGHPALLEPAQHADGEQVVEGEQRRRPRGQARVGRGRPALHGGRERAEALRRHPGRPGGRGQPRPPLLLAPRVAGAGQVGDAAVAQPREVRDDLSGAVGQVVGGHVAEQPGQRGTGRRVPGVEDLRRRGERPGPRQVPGDDSRGEVVEGRRHDARADRPHRRRAAGEVAHPPRPEPGRRQVLLGLRGEVDVRVQRFQPPVGAGDQARVQTDVIGADHGQTVAGE